MIGLLACVVLLLNFLALGLLYMLSHVLLLMLVGKVSLHDLPEAFQIVYRRSFMAQFLLTPLELIYRLCRRLQR